MGSKIFTPTGVTFVSQTPDEVIHAICLAQQTTHKMCRLNKTTGVIYLPYIDIHRIEER
jgi:hypothetical protein